jgi:hypothetical protein
MSAELECYENELYVIAVTDEANPNIVFYFKDDYGRLDDNVEIQLSDVDQFAIDLKRLKDAVVKRLDCGVDFIAA